MEILKIFKLNEIFPLSSNIPQNRKQVKPPCPKKIFLLSDKGNSPKTQSRKKSPKSILGAKKIPKKEGELIRREEGRSSSTATAMGRHFFIAVGGINLTSKSLVFGFSNNRKRGICVDSDWVQR
jgi:hypothetical protein